MAFKMEERKCEKCGKIYEKLVDSREEDNEPCPSCGAERNSQKIILGNPTHQRHFSWQVS